MQHAGYLREGLLETREVIENAQKTLYGLHFDGIVVTGLSGMLIGPILAYVMNKKLAIVRKESDKCHSNCVIESNFDKNTSWIFIDDLISSGDTYDYVMHAADRCSQQNASVNISNYIGNYLYIRDKFTYEQATFDKKSGRVCRKY